jgi:hypothetical protein
MPIALSDKTFVVVTQNFVTPGQSPAVVPMGTEVGAGTPYPIPVTMEPVEGEVSALKEKTVLRETESPSLLADKPAEEEPKQAPKRR